MKAFELRKKEYFPIVFEKHFSKPDFTDSLDPLAEVFLSIRNEDFKIVLDFLKTREKIRLNFKKYIHHLFAGKPFVVSLTEANILSESSFFPEFKKRILNQVLPAVDNENTIWHLVDYVLVNPRKDLEYFRNIEEDDLGELFRLLGIQNFISKQEVKKEIYLALNILSWRAIGNAMHVEVINMAPEYRDYDNPFVSLQHEIEELTQKFQNNPLFAPDAEDIDYKQVNVFVEQSLEFVNVAFKNAAQYGISGKINQSLIKIRQQIQRISDLLHVLEINEEKEVLQKSKLLFFSILEYKSKKNNLKELFSDSTTLISNLITNHTAEMGVHYISSTMKDYWKMFRKASGGGIIVGCLVVFKMFLGYAGNSDFFLALLYSFNYAAGFIAIFLLRFTLATKQPAMTAATMAKVLSDEENTSKNYVEFSHLVAKLFRSQFIAFVGNVLLAFPVALLIIYGLDVIFDKNFAVSKSTKLLTDVNLFQSKALLHASIAGFYLFISGIISGNVSNNSVYYQIPKRILKNPLINQFFGRKLAERLSKFYSRNWAGVVSNFWFGVFLGSTYSVGHFLGLDLDIRHITFSAGNFALGLYGKEFQVDTLTIVLSVLTIVLIGLCNFLVSFGLSMTLAFRSRKVNFGEVRQIYREIFRYFLKNPLRFFFPIRSFLDGRAREMVEKTRITKSPDR